MLEALVQEVRAVVHDGTGVDVVDARQQEVVGVDEVVGDVGAQGFDPDVKAPEELKDLSRKTW